MLKAAEYTFNIIVNIGGHAFMAPAGAQGVGISVQAISCLEHAILILILLSRVCLRYLSLLHRTAFGALNTLSCFILYMFVY